MAALLNGLKELADASRRGARPCRPTWVFHVRTLVEIAASAAGHPLSAGVESAGSAAAMDALRGPVLAVPAGWRSIAMLARTGGTSLAVKPLWFRHAMTHHRLHWLEMPLKPPTRRFVICENLSRDTGPRNTHLIIVLVGDSSAQSKSHSL